MLDRTTRTIILKNFLINQLFLYRKYKVLIRVYSIELFLVSGIIGIAGVQ